MTGGFSFSLLTPLSVHHPSIHPSIRQAVSSISVDLLRPFVKLIKKVLMSGGKSVGIQNDPRTEDMAKVKVEREEKEDFFYPKRIVYLVKFNDLQVFKLSPHCEGARC